MFDFTPQERKAILFLIIMVLSGVGINFTLKVNSQVERFIRIDEDMNKLDLNSASCEELVSIKGCSLRLAKNIIEYRDRYGPFRHLKDLKQVKGIGEFRFNKIKESLSIK